MSFGGLDGFGSFKKSYKIKVKGAGTSVSDKAKYDQLEAEAELNEALKEKEHLLKAFENGPNEIYED